MNTSFHQDILEYISENILASAMFGAALNIGVDKFLEEVGYCPTEINDYRYFDFCGY
jgi:hypothetical protein